jgi:hypothetical protein
VSFLSLVAPAAQQPVVAKTRMTFRLGPSVCGHATEWSDIHRAIRFSQSTHGDGTLVFFTEVEYQLFSLLVENYLQKKKEVSYEEIASKVFALTFESELLPVIRKRMSAIRKKIVGFGIDIISITQRGYELRSLEEGLVLPYRRGHRAHASFCTGGQREL